MTINPLEQYKIAAGLSVALNSLVNIETIKPTNDQYFYAPKAIPYGSPGVKRVKLNSVSYRAGYPSVDWLFSVLTRAQYEYLRNTFCAGGYSGQVTIYSTVSSSVYARYNAVMDVPETSAIPDGWYAYKNVAIHMTHLVAL
jgi:hypothetical protein